MSTSKDYFDDFLSQSKSIESALLMKDKLEEEFWKFWPLSFQGSKNDVTSFKNIGKVEIKDDIATIKGCNKWEYMQENKFLTQKFVGKKVFVFKMLEKCFGLRMYLVRQMQLAKNHQNRWIMFDYVKGVKD